MASDSQHPLERLEAAIRADGRYPLEAYEFLNRGLQSATESVFGRASEERPGPRHVSGGELCRALAALALAQWGGLARTVLENWNIRSTRDFGEMVFLLVELELMGAQESDRIEDFDAVYDFAGVFDRYEIPIGAGAARE